MKNKICPFAPYELHKTAAPGLTTYESKPRKCYRVGCQLWDTQLGDCRLSFRGLDAIAIELRSLIKAAYNLGGP